MIFIYSFCVAVSVITFLLLYITDLKKSICQNIMMLIMAISNLGYLALCISGNLEEAILANKILYVGGCFLPILYFFTVCEVCHVTLKKCFTVPMILVQVGLFTSVCSIGYSDLYYKNVQFLNSHLVKEYGPLHLLFIITVLGYFACSFAVAMFSVFKKKTVNHKELRNMVLCAGLAVSCYAIQRGFHMDIPIMPISYLILIIGAIVPIYHSNMYTVTENKEIVDEQLNKVGFITFNKRMEYMGCNNFASKVFPELIDCEIGREISGCGEILNNLIKSIKTFKDEVKQQGNKIHIHRDLESFSIGDRYFDCEIHTINDITKRCTGFNVELRDVTVHHTMIELTTQYNEKLEREVDAKTKKILTIQEKTILGMAQIVESRDLSTGGHIKRTSDVVRIFSKKLKNSDLGLSQNFLNLVIRSAPMHDLGKIGVDDAILRKQGKFTDEEYEQMKKHSELGAKMVSDILTDVEEKSFVKVARNVAHYHHEKVNGKGYPEGLKGEEIPIEARIMALADVFDALVSKRCYKEAFSYDEAFEIIKKDSGTHFDSILAEIFLTCRPELEEYYNSNINC